jgi:hypothetical protein
MAKKTTKSYIKKFDEFSISMCDFLSNYEDLTYYEAMLLVATPKSQLILDERCVGDNGTMGYLQDTANLLLEDGFETPYEIGDNFDNSKGGDLRNIVNIDEKYIYFDTEKSRARGIKAFKYNRGTFDRYIDAGVIVIKKQTQQQPNEYANNTQDELKQLIKAFTYLAQKGDKEAQEELIILQKLTTENPKFKTGDNVVVYDTSGTKAIYNAEIKFIDKDGYARLVTDTGFVISKVITNESKDVKLKTK